ncbi:MAG: hypothetical protein ACJ71T_01450 [Actinomycetales bacterium]
MRRRAVVLSVAALAVAVLTPVTGGAAFADGNPISGGTGVYGAVTVGTYVEQTFTLTAADPTLTVSGAATVTGANPDAFKITDDSCNGVSLSVGETCTVTVAAAPQAGGNQTAQLSIPDSSASGSESMALSVNGFWPNQGDYYPISTARILDTRIHVGQATNTPVAKGSTLTLQVTGRGGVPVTDVAAVALNVTVVAPASGGYVTVYPSGLTRPGVSNVNFAAGHTIANQVTVPVGADGAVKIYNGGGTAHLVADVMGWYAKDDTVPGAGYGQSYHLVQPERLIDSRQAFGKLPAHEWFDLDVSYGDPWNASMSAFAMTVTAVNPGAGGYLTAYRPGSSPTTTSTLNFRPGVVTPNLAIVRTAPCNGSWCEPGDPIIRIYNGSSEPVDVLVDAVGLYADTTLENGLRYRPLTPTRIVDTRVSKGATTLFTGSTRLVTAPSSVAGDDTFALSANVTAIRPTMQTYLTLWPQYSNFPRPTVSQLNPAAGSTVANSVALEVGAGNKFNVYNHAGTVDVAVDVSGSFEMFPPFQPTPAFAGQAGSGSALAAPVRPALGVLPSAPGPALVHRQP